MIYLLTSCNTEERKAQNIYIHNSNRNIKKKKKKKSTTRTILIKKRIGIGYKNYEKQCPGLEFRKLNSKAHQLGWLKIKKFKKTKRLKNSSRLITYELTNSNN